MVSHSFANRVTLTILLSCFAYCVCESSTEQGELQVFPIHTQHAVRNRYLQERATGNDDKLTMVQNVGRFETVTEVYQGYGAHFIDLWVGTPPQRQTVLVDTGSSSTAFPCNKCYDCGQGYHMDKIFNFSLSHSYKQLTCEECLRGTCSLVKNECALHLSYVEGSTWDALEVSDYITFGGFHNESNSLLQHDERKFLIRHDEEDKYESVGIEKFKFRSKFGCQTNMTGLFKYQLADGILGMSHSKESLWRQMYDANVILSQRFSLCYVKNPIAHFDGAQAGALVFGGTDKRLHNAPMVYTDFSKDNRFYEVTIRKMYINPDGGEFLTGPDADIKLSTSRTKEILTTEKEINEGGPIVDSGTTCVYLNKKIEKAFNMAWYEVMGFDFPQKGVAIDGEKIRHWPTIIFQLRGSKTLNGDEKSLNLQNKAAILDPNNPDDILIAFPPSHYMEYSLRNGTYNSRLEFKENNGPVLGASLMQGHDILFDIENKRIGFAESNCDYKYLTTGQRSKVYDPFRLKQDLMYFYIQRLCRSDDCRSLVYISFWASHLGLLVLYSVLYIIRKRSSISQKSLFDKLLSIKSKASGELDIESYEETKLLG